MDAVARAQSLRASACDHTLYARETLLIQLRQSEVRGLHHALHRPAPADKA
jgi:hypothetical protein